MHRLLFLATLATYGTSALELHEWAHVPQAIMHLVEHHSDFGHHDVPGEHHHDDENDHDPFGCEHHEACCGSLLVSVVCEPHTPMLSIPAGQPMVAPVKQAAALAAFSGSKWNPPKLA